MAKKFDQNLVRAVKTLLNTYSEQDLICHIRHVVMEARTDALKKWDDGPIPQTYQRRVGDDGGL